MTEQASSASATPLESRSIPSTRGRLIFLISPPRAGSTLLMRILNATDAIFSRPEPHLMTPLAHLGYFENVDKAPYDHLQSQQATRAFVRDLPHGEDDYVDAVRAYADVLYGRMLETAPGGERYFLDKTPAYALIVEFLARVFPDARYIVLTRHPAAIFSSYADSFFDGNFEEAVKFNPILSRYIPKMAWLLRERPVPLLHVKYEDLVTQPEEELRRISEFLEIPYTPEALEYKRKEVKGEGLGDPIGVKQHSRPVTSSVDKWARKFVGHDEKVRIVAEQLATVSDEDLELWGYPRETIWEPLASASPAPEAKKKWDKWSAQRRVLVWLRKDVDRRPWGPWLRKLRFYCDVILRDGFAVYAPEPHPESPLARGEPERAFPGSGEGDEDAGGAEGEPGPGEEPGQDAGGSPASEPEREG